MRTILLFLGWLASSILLSSCQSSDPLAGLPDTQLSGAQLAQRYCSGCHLFPNPSLLDQNTWLSSVLPAMSWRLGIRDSMYLPLQGRNMHEQYLIRQASIFPDSAALSQESWQKIVAYYDSLAPKKLSLPSAKIDTIHEAAPFEPHPVSLGLGPRSFFTLLRQHPQTGDIYLADGTPTLHQLNSSGKPKDFFEVPGIVTDIYFLTDGTSYLLTAGLLNPHDEPLGKIFTMDAQGNIELLLSGLHRPVHMNVHDVDQDGLDDIIVCEFGNHLGRLSWFRCTEDRTFQQYVLWETPGAIKTYVRDLDQDGGLDIVVLIGQGREGVYAFYNRGEGRFRMKPLLQFPPVYGSSDFALVDIDQDSDEDIVVVFGDNADLSNVLKPYHGLRVYRNEGDDQFVEAYFYPMHGATRVVSKDFDQDGDIDLAASAFFPDEEEHGPHSFVYLEHTATDARSFLPRTLPGSHGDRWLFLEPIFQADQAAPGIMLGASNLRLERRQKESVEPWNANSVDFVILNNVAGTNSNH